MLPIRSHGGFKCSTLPAVHDSIAETEKKDSDGGHKQKQEEKIRTPPRHVERLSACGHSLEGLASRAGRGGACGGMPEDVTIETSWHLPNCLSQWRGRGKKSADVEEAFVKCR